MKTLQAFKDSCRHWKKYRADHNWQGRQAAYSDLIKRHGGEACLRHVKLIKAVLDKAEVEA